MYSLRYGTGIPYMPKKSKKSQSKQRRVSFGPSRRTSNGRTRGRMSSAPASFRGMAPPNQYSMSNCSDPILGPGLRLSASNTVTGVSHINGYSYVFPQSPYWHIGISPDILSNGIAQLAKNFQFYRFTRLVFRYSPACPTTTSRTLRFAYVPDGAYGTVENMPTFAGSADFEFNWSTASWSPASYVIARVPRGAPAYYNRTGDAAAGLRETTQGSLIGLIDADPGATLAVGSIVVDFVIELFAKTTNLAFSVNRREYDEFKSWQAESKNSPLTATVQTAFDGGLPAAVPDVPDSGPMTTHPEPIGIGAAVTGQSAMPAAALSAPGGSQGRTAFQAATGPTVPQPLLQRSGFRC